MLSGWTGEFVELTALSVCFGSLNKPLESLECLFGLSGPLSWQEFFFSSFVAIFNVILLIKEILRYLGHMKGFMQDFFHEVHS